jgi:predicted small lipoprotein YifL
MERVVLTALVVVFGVALLVGCGRKGEEEVPAEDVKEKVKEAAEAVASYTKQEIEAFREKAGDTLAGYGEKIKELDGKAEEIESDLQSEYRKARDELSKKQEAVAKKLEELKSASGQAWNDARPELEQAMKDLQSAYEKARSRLQSPGVDPAPEGDAE